MLLKLRRFAFKCLARLAGQKMRAMTPADVDAIVSTTLDKLNEDSEERFLEALGAVDKERLSRRPAGYSRRSLPS